MKKLLLITTSPSLAGSSSRLLASKFIHDWQQAFPEDQVVVRDIGQEPIPHLTNDGLPALTMDKAIPTGQATRDRSDQLINELRTCDMVVIAAPMHNFSIPSTLKAYFDHVARIGETIGFSENGLKGLLEDKSAVVITTGGGMNQNTPRDFQGPYIKQFLGFIGIDDVTFIQAQGLLYGEEVKAQALKEAGQQIESFVSMAVKSRQIVHADEHNGIHDAALKLESEFEYLDYSAQLFRPVKEASYQLCGLSFNGEKTNKTVLDIGCGVGKDTLAMAQLTSPDSQIVGIDLNESVINRANQRAQDGGMLNVKHLVMGAMDLTDAQRFDCVRSERVFQHLDDPNAVLSVMVNAAKPNGTIVVVDTDWTSLTAKTLTAQENQQVSEFFAKKLPNGAIANNIHSLFKQAGLANVSVERMTTPLTRNDYDKITQRPRFFQACFPNDKAHAVVTEKCEQVESNEAFATLDSVLVSGVKL